MRNVLFVGVRNPILCYQILIPHTQTHRKISDAVIRGNLTIFYADMFSKVTDSLDTPFACAMKCWGTFTLETKHIIKHLIKKCHDGRD